MRLLRLQIRAPKLRGQSLKPALKVLGVVTLLPALYLMAAVLGAVLPGAATPDNTPRTHEVLLISGPIHYDLLLPLDAEAMARFAPLLQTGLGLDHPAAEWLVVGWGAQDFYTQTRVSTDLRFPALWRGIIGDRSVLRVDIVGALNPDLPVRRLALTAPEYTALLASIWTSFDLGADGIPARVNVAGYTLTDGFYAARGTFNILRTCNVWIGERLRAAGLRFGLWTPMPLSVSLSFDLYQGE